MKHIAAIFAHPDDEILGCGATMARHARDGDQVRILILATGLTSRGEAEKEQIDALRSQAQQAAKVVGAKSVEFCDFPDNAMDSVALLDVVKAVEGFLNTHPFDIIYTHHVGDMNIDHNITHRAVMTACRPMPGKRPVEVLSCEVNSSTEWSMPSQTPFVPNDFIDVADFLDIKVAAMECYSGEICEWPHPRSSKGIRVTAKNRGMQSGFQAAEAFMLTRRVRALVNG